MKSSFGKLVGGVGFGVVVTIFMMTSCAGKNTSITVITREDGSGTRSVFTELLGIVDGGVDNTTGLAEVSNSTAVVLQSVADNRNAIGYISLGSMSDSVKAVQVDGVAPTTGNVQSGQYRLARPFILVTQGNSDVQDAQSLLVEDFIAFILSDDGQQVVEQKGYIRVAGENLYVPTGLKGTIVVAGSTSVAPVMEALADRYRELNPDVTIQIQQTGSSAGITSTLEGASHIGMTSRNLSQKELEQGIEPVVLALDGIALIVNRQNVVDNLSADQIKDIYTGTVQDWTAIQEDW